MPLIHRLAPAGRAIGFSLDGVACEGRAGDTLLTAILSLGEALQHSDVSGEPRAGFCQMGACQDCWVGLAGGGRVRACTTALAEGMEIVTDRAPAP